MNIYLFYVYDFDHDGILTLALVRVGGGGAVPRLVVVEWQTLAAVRSGRVVLALTDEALVLQVLRRSTRTVAAVAVALAPGQPTLATLTTATTTTNGRPTLADCTGILTL